MNDKEQYLKLLREEVKPVKIGNKNKTGECGVCGIREGVDKAIKQYIYSKKDTIIDRVVDRATVEIVKKGLPKLLEKAIATDVKEVTP